MAVSNMSRKAKFEDVVKDKEALEYHVRRYEAGSVYQLAKDCFQYAQLQKTRGDYEIFKDQQRVAS
jgi:hypothetical protein